MIKKIVIILLIFMIITETIILYTQNMEVDKGNNDLLKILDEYNVVIDDKINLDEIRLKRNALQEEAKDMFGENNYEDMIENKKQQEEKLNNDIKLLENEIKGLESKIGNLEK